MATRCNVLCYKFKDVSEQSIDSILPSSGLLRSVGWLRTDVSGQPIGPIFKGPTAAEAYDLAQSIVSIFRV